MKGAATRGAARNSGPAARRFSINRDLLPADLLALYSGRDLERFIDEMFRVLPRLVRCEYVSAFYQRAGDEFLKERDSRGRVWGRAFLRRYVELTPAIPLVMANPGIKILATRFALTGSEAELHRSAFYREVMQPQGWRHGAVLCFWGVEPASFPILVVSLYRTAGQPDFADDDLAVLEGVHPFLAPAVSRFHEVSASDAVSEGVASTLRHVSPGILVLDWQMRVVRVTLAGRRVCAKWNRTSADGPRLPQHPVSVPGALQRACDELRAELNSTMRRNSEAKAQRRRYVHHPESPALSASVTAICLPTALAEPTFVIEFIELDQVSGHGGRASLLAHLTKSEREVALVVAEGLSNEEAAEKLGKTIHAIKFLLHRTYRKVGVSNRTRLGLLLRGNG